MPTLTDRSQEHRVSRSEFEAIRQAGSDLLRFELLDGEVLITPGCSVPHQRALMELLIRLDEALRPSTWVLPGPFDVVLGDAAGGDTVLQPDLLVVDRDDLDLQATALLVPPLLVAEVLSPMTFRRDLGPKRDAYEAGGVEHYWVVAPDIPSITVYSLGPDGAYREEAHLTGDEHWSTTAPVEVTLCPADLVR